MVDRSIPFKGPMVRAIIEDRKTQTRRVLDPQPVPASSWGRPPGTYPSATGWKRIPYATGDRLWVREAWRAPIAVDHLPPRDIWATTPACYEADGSQQPGHGIEWGRYRHSMFMPRWASRLTLIVESVRIERLQEIIEEDAAAEGIRRDVYSSISAFDDPAIARAQPADMPVYDAPPWCGEHTYCRSARDAFELLWTGINGPGSWDGNPWVAAITFRSILANIDQIDANGRPEARA
jgi:hypothetical protein